MAQAPTILQAISDLKRALLSLGLAPPLAITLAPGQRDRFEAAIRREAVGTFVRDPTLSAQTSVYGIGIEEAQ